ncbi:MAG: rod shape-determining protein RodA [Candidatus Omnitrophica bacterium]|nr:rod shape-determining protein RodA [Candidatus Omnitrophota bacterium]
MNFTVPKYLKEIHWPIVVLTLLLAFVGMVAIYSASFREAGDYTTKQFFWALVALGIFVATIWIGYRAFLNLANSIYMVTIGLLIWVLFFAPPISGAHSWIKVGPFQIQPSEFAKIATIMVLANFLAARSPIIHQKRNLILAFFLVALPTLLVLKQPDLGSALVFLPLLLAMIFYWGVNIRYLVILFLLSFASLPMIWSNLKPYQQKRILVFMNPSIDPIGASYTAIQSKIAVGSGGLLGKGWLEGTQTQLDFVPEHHTDFIFCVLAEEFGFLGVLAVILLFVLLIRSAYQVMNHTTDLRAKLLALGIASYLAFQVFINIGMTIGITPITGLTLPFLSYGGSSLVTTFFALGLVASIYKERSIF